MLAQSVLEQGTVEKARAQAAKVMVESAALYNQQEAKRLAEQQALDAQEAADLYKAASASIVSVRAESRNNRLFQTLLSYLRFMPNRKTNLDNLKEFDPKNRAPFNYTVSDFGLFEVIFEMATEQDLYKFQDDVFSLHKETRGVSMGITINTIQRKFTFSLDNKQSQEVIAKLEI